MSQGYPRYSSNLFLDTNDRYNGYSTHARSGSDTGDGSNLSLYGGRNFSTPGPSRSRSPDLGFDPDFENPRFRELWQENTRLKAEIEALKMRCEQEKANAAKFFTLLGDALKQPTSAAATTGTGSGTTLSPSSQPAFGQVVSGQEQLQRELDKLPPLPLDPNPSDAQFENCKYWFQSNVAEDAEFRANNSLARMTKWEHITDVLGNAVSEQVLDAVFAKLTSTWDHLHYLFMAPVTWGVKAPIVALYVKTVMYNAFPWLQYCDGDWKLHNICTDRFAQWTRTRNSKPQCPMLAKALGIPIAAPFAPGSRKRRGGDTSDARKKARAERETAKAAPTSSASSSVKPSSQATPQTSSAAGIFTATASTSTSVPNSTGSQQPPGQFSILSGSGPSHPHNLDANNMWVQATPLPAPGPNPAFKLPEDGSGNFEENTASGLAESGKCRASPSDFEFAYSRSASPNNVPPQTNAQAATTQAGGDNESREPPASMIVDHENNKDLFAGIDIPPPAKTAPIIQGPSQPPPPKKKAASSGNGKAETPTAAVTARNLCLVDYIKIHGHGITKSDFTIYFNQQLPKPVRKDYENLSKQRKKASAEEQLQPSSILENYLKTLASTRDSTSAPPPSW
ncbi:hypothetical protein EST38_g11452 [Candolleomyces aberdarensis]|uniref:Uncharacterized protein n=1 Tax=Candolleomyces aberdarensis TaxID=2316362 RepID=A0A4Q2D848_9AGAR|nr:hypothetical protein EST38_g11452 [Candolleomyces aberdarensis]